MVERYGDFVLYRPPVKPITWLLWIGPFILLLIGIAGLFTYLCRRNAAVSNIVLSDDDNQRIDALLKNAEQDKKGAQ
jgi:cytochrome c-type biogenesis protein CcmH